MRFFFRIALIAAVFCFSFCAESTGAGDAKRETFQSLPAKLTLHECIDLALRENRTRLVSQSSQAIAAAQYQQALSAYWPTFSLEVTGVRRDQDPNFIFPSSTFSLGPVGAQIAESVAATQLAKAGVTPSSVGLSAYNTALAAATQNAAAQMPTFTIPAQNIKLFDRDVLTSSLKMQYPLYTGGKIAAMVREGKMGVEASAAEARRTDLQIVRDTKQYYYGSVLARRMLTLAEEALERFQVTLELTESLYQHGSGRVKKTDYLRTQVVVASLKSLVALMRSQEELARMALGNTMGLPWQLTVSPAETEIPFVAYNASLSELVRKAHALNPQLMQIGYGVSAAEAGIDKAKSGHLPVVVLFGSIDRIGNSFKEGLTTDQNRRSWSLGLSMQLPLFNGFRVTNEVREAEARKEKLRHEQYLLQEGVALQVKDAFLQIARSVAQVETTRDAVKAATENRQLHERAYQSELVETKEVIESQLTELFMHGQYEKSLYDTQYHQSAVEYLVGQSLEVRP